MREITFDEKFLGSYGFLLGLLDYEFPDKNETYVGTYPTDFSSQTCIMPGSHGRYFRILGRAGMLPRELPYVVEIEDGVVQIAQAGYYNVDHIDTSAENLIPAVYVIRENVVEVRLGQILGNHWPRHGSMVEIYMPYTPHDGRESPVEWRLASERIGWHHTLGEQFYYYKCPTRLAPKYLSPFIRHFAAMIAKTLDMKVRMRHDVSQPEMTYSISPSPDPGRSLLILNTPLRHRGPTSLLKAPTEAIKLFSEVTSRTVLREGMPYTPGQALALVGELFAICDPLAEEAFRMVDRYDDEHPSDQAAEPPPAKILEEKPTARQICETQILPKHEEAIELAPPGLAWNTPAERSSVRAEIAEVYRNVRVDGALPAELDLPIWALVGEELIAFITDIYLRIRSGQEVGAYKEFVTSWWGENHVTLERVLVADVFNLAFSKA